VSSYLSFMARTKTITDEQILEAAREMFDRHGLTVTTAQIAEAAGVSEGSIYRRWESKQSLMIAAFGIRKPPAIEQMGELMESGKPIEEQLWIIANGLLDFFLENLPKMSALLACGLKMKEKILQSTDALPVQAVRAVMGFFEHHRRQGTIRTSDPEVAARMFVASIHHYAFAEYVGLNDMLPMPRETYVRGVVDTLLRGLDARGQRDEINE